MATAPLNLTFDLARMIEMKNGGRFWLIAGVIALSFVNFGFAQKMKIGFDKSVNFSKYKTYSWAKPEMPVTRPLLYQNVVGTIDDDLKSKGLQRVEANGDLTLMAAGGIGFGYNMPAAPNMNTTYWSGEVNDPILMAPQVAQGTLVLEFIDRNDNKLVWRGRSSENLDPDQKEKSLTRIQKAIVKLLKGFPPKTASK